MRAGAEGAIVIQWPSYYEWKRLDANTLECRCVMLSRPMPEMFRGIDVPKRPIVDVDLRALAYRFLGRGQ
jgi:hypothetical protein